MHTETKESGQSLTTLDATKIHVSSSDNDHSRQIGYDLLGPVVHRWMLALHQYVHYFNDGNTAFLFCARAGVRIARLYEIFVRGFHAGECPKPSMFWISRFAVAKGIYNRDRKRAVEIIAREYQDVPLRQLVEGIFRHHPERLSGHDLSGSDLNAHGFNFPGWLTVNAPLQNVVRDYLSECGKAFECYLAETLQGSSRAVLIDSGWQGSAQSLLKHAFPDNDWKGLYFGRILTEHHDPKIVGDVIGLMFERNEYDPAIPESAFARHRHLIETLFEPNGPSVEEIVGGAFKTVAERLVAANLNETPHPIEDRLYLEVKSYVEDNATLPISEIVKRHSAAMPKLARAVITPTRDVVHALYCKARSADFGKKLLVPVLTDSPNKCPTEKDRRIAAALWQEGQVALEYEGEVARDMQLRLSGITNETGYFDPVAGAEQTPDNSGALVDVARPAVAIITRTKNRPLLLRRAAESVARQTFPDYVWVVVNDGGDVNAVNDIIERCAVDRRRILLVSNLKSLGMEAASNAGIRASSSDYIVIHDDDDSWAPTFLAESVCFLRSSNAARYGGVITKSVYVSEEIRGESVVEHGRHPYQDWVRNVQLAEMACGNFFPPIAFLFKRAVWEKVGGYNERLPVLGDWFFNMEFLLHADIGVLPKPLAYYHHRDRGDSRSGLYSNSVIGGVSKHEEFAAIARNEFLRRHADKTSAALSVVLGYVVGDMRSRLAQPSTAATQESLTSSPSEASLASVRNEGQPSRALVDLYWSASQINRVLVERRRFFSRRKEVRPLGAEARWTDVLAAIRSLGVAIPPPDDFDEAAYLRENPDVERAVKNGAARSGYMHYLVHGRPEGRVRPIRRV